MKNYKARERKQNKKKNGMRVSGRSVLLLERLTVEKAERIKLENKKAASESESNKQYSK